jgi:hypothetical protein
MDMEKKKGKRTQQSETQTDRDKDTNGQVQGHKWRETLVYRNTDGQGLGQSR